MQMSRLTNNQLKEILDTANMDYDASGEASGNPDLFHLFAKDAAESLFNVNPNCYNERVMNDFTMKVEDSDDNEYNDNVSHIPFEMDIDHIYEGSMC